MMIAMDHDGQPFGGLTHNVPIVADAIVDRFMICRDSLHQARELGHVGIDGGTDSWWHRSRDKPQGHGDTKGRRARRTRQPATRTAAARILILLRVPVFWLPLLRRGRDSRHRS